MAVESQKTKALRAVTNRLQLINPQRVMDKLQAGEEVKGCWGTAPTGKPHIGYLLPLIKIAECIAAGIHAGVLIGDSYAYLINHDVSLEIIEYRTQYYVFLMTAILKALGVPPSNIHISRESDYAMSVQFCKNKMRLCAVSTQSEIRSVGPEVHDTPWISPLVCPIHQALCDVHLGTDFQMGGLDQRGVFEYSYNTLPRINFEPGTYIMTALIPALKSGKMSSSGAPETKIMFTDSGDAVEAKIAGADLPTGNDTANNGIMAMFEHIVFPFEELRSTTAAVEIRLVGGDGTKRYTDFEDLKDDVSRGLVESEDLRRVLAAALNSIMEPVREEYRENKEWRLVEQQAYDAVGDTAP